MTTIDPPVVKGLFGTKLKKRRNKQHNPRTVSKDYDEVYLNELASAIKHQSKEWSTLSKGELRTAVDKAAMELTTGSNWVLQFIETLPCWSRGYTLTPNGVWN
jgi:hypothetical protein